MRKGNMSCQDFEDAMVEHKANCCNSCHDEINEGYGYHFDTEWEGRTVYCCCSVLELIEKLKERKHEKT
jgi:hypothetical protein